MKKYENLVKGSVKWFLPFCLFTFLPLLCACSESDDDDFDYDEWKSLNDTYFEKAYQSHSASSSTVFILPSWSQPASKTLSEIAHTDCILVDVLESGDGATSPYYTDSVQVHYSGRLIPTTDYPQGFEFDRSWLTTFDAEVDMPAQFKTSAVVAGFSTALQHMHRGDRWRVTVPYQLGYGSTVKSTIPAYSSLIFDIRLVDFWNKTKGDRE